MAWFKCLKEAPLTFPITVITGTDWTNQTIEDSKHLILDNVTVSTWGNASKGNAGFKTTAPSNQDASCGGSITIKLKPNAIGKTARLVVKFYVTARNEYGKHRITNGSTSIYAYNAPAWESPTSQYNSSFTITSDTITISTSWGTSYSSAWTPNDYAGVWSLIIDE